MDFETKRARILSQAALMGKEVRAHTTDKLEKRFLIFSLMMLSAIAIVIMLQNNHLWYELKALRAENQELAQKVEVFYTAPAAYPSDVNFKVLPPPEIVTKDEGFQQNIFDAQPNRPVHTEAF